jgi:hypothetical protein
VQVTVGAAVLPVDDPMNPNDVLAPPASVPFQATLVAVTVDPLVVTVAFQACVSAWPDGNVTATDQPAIGADPAVTFTSPWNPLFHRLTAVNAAVQP